MHVYMLKHTRAHSPVDIQTYVCIHVLYMFQDLVLQLSHPPLFAPTHPSPPKVFGHPWIKGYKGHFWGIILHLYGNLCCTLIRVVVWQHVLLQLSASSTVLLPAIQRQSASPSTAAEE